MANLHLKSAISFEEFHKRVASSGVALAMTYNRLVLEKRTLGLDLDLDEEADCFLHGKSTIRSFFILLVLSSPIPIIIWYSIIYNVVTGCYTGGIIDC